MEATNSVYIFYLREGTYGGEYIYHKPPSTPYDFSSPAAATVLIPATTEEPLILPKALVPARAEVTHLEPSNTSLPAVFQGTKNKSTNDMVGKLAIVVSSLP